MSTPALRSTVLTIYKKILNTAKTWKAKVTTTREREGGLKEHRAKKKNGLMKFIKLHMYQGSFENPAATDEERAYIRAEAQRLFRANKALTSERDIAQCLREAEARLEIGSHYQYPYPRPVHFPPLAITRTQARQWGTANLRRQRRARPVYTTTLHGDGGQQD